MKQRNLWKRGILSLTLVFGLLLVGCPTDPEEGTTETTYTVSQNGSASSPTTSLTFAFSADVSDLAITDIALGGAASKSGGLSGSGKSYTLPITVNASGSATVKITKDGIESGTKSVQVYKGDGTNPNPDPDPGTDPDTTTETAISGGANSGAAAELTLASEDNARWYADSIAASGVKWYKFTAEASKTYHVQWWDDIGQPTGKEKTAWVKTTAYQSNGTTAINSSAWTSGWSQITESVITTTDAGVIYLKFEPYSANYAGTYALRVYDTAALVPQGPTSMYAVDAMAKNAVYVSWVDYSPNVANVKYKVSRSDTQNGTYAQLDGELTVTSYTDTMAANGQKYWYKVEPFNTVGTGATIAAVQSDTVGSFSPATEITISRTAAAAAKADLTEINFTSVGEVKWYKFTAEAGVTYKVQWAEQYLGPSGAGYTGDVHASAFKADGDHVSTISWVRNTSSWSSGGTSISGQTGTVYLKFVADKAGTIGYTVWKDSTTTTPPVGGGGGTVKSDPPTSPSGLPGRTFTVSYSTQNTALAAGKKVYVVVYAQATPDMPLAWGRGTAQGTTGTGAINLFQWSDNSTIWSASSGSFYWRILIGDSTQDYTHYDYYTYQGSGTTETAQGLMNSTQFSSSWKLGSGTPPGMPGF